MKTNQARKVIDIEEHPKGKNVMENSVIVAFTISAPGVNRKVDPDLVEVEADKKMLRISKEILDSDELRDAVRYAVSIRSYIKRMGCSSYFKGGLFILPISLVEEVDNTVKEMEKTLWKKIERFLKVYPERVKEAKKRLDKLFSEEDYPSVEALRRSFSIDIRYISFATPGKLKDLNLGMFKREQDKLQAYWNEAAEQMQYALREAMSRLLASMIDTVAGEKNKDGKRKAFRKESIEKMERFLDDFAKRDVTNDAKLASLVSQAKKILKGTDAEILKSDTDLRQRIVKDFKPLQSALSKMVQDKPVRGISFEGEE